MISSKQQRINQNQVAGYTMGKKKHFRQKRLVRFHTHWFIEISFERFAFGRFMEIYQWCIGGGGLYPSLCLHVVECR